MITPGTDPFDWLVSQPDWGPLLRHFQLAEGFSLVVLLTPSEAVAARCREALEDSFEAGNAIQIVPTKLPEDLEDIGGTLLNGDFHLGEHAHCVWVGRVISQDATDFPRWRDAWRVGVSRLNQFRNRLVRKFPVTVLFSGAPWVQQTMREDAPDLWSIRSMVAHIAPVFEPYAGKPPANSSYSPHGTRFAPDPDLAEEALRTLPGPSQKPSGQKRGASTQADLLLRAAEGFLARGDLEKAEHYARLARQGDGEPSQEVQASLVLAEVSAAKNNNSEAIHLYQGAIPVAEGLGRSDLVAQIYHRLGQLAHKQGDLDLAQTYYRRSLDEYRKASDPTGVASVNFGLGVAALQRNDVQLARECFLRCLEGGDNPLAVSAYSALASIARGLGDAEGSESLWRRAKELYDNADEADRELIRKAGFDVTGPVNSSPPG